MTTLQIPLRSHQQTTDGCAEARPSLNLRPGEIAQVRSEADILGTLDKDLTLQSLPFMPEMRQYCGRSFRVVRRVNKFIIEGRRGLRSIRDTVILDGPTCDGSAHGGCQYACLLLWKEQWLERPAAPAEPASPAADTPTILDNIQDGGGEPFACQSTSLPRASSLLSLWELPQQYLRDLQEGELRPGTLARAWLIVSYNKIRRRLGRSKQYPIHGNCESTPRVTLNLQPGELVQVRSKEEIAATLDRKGRNRGLEMFPEMLNCCGERYRVLNRVDKMVVAPTGKLKKIADTVLLEGAICNGEAHFNCHRSCRFLWREIWLERV